MNQYLLEGTKERATRDRSGLSPFMGTALTLSPSRKEAVMSRFL